MYNTSGFEDTTVSTEPTEVISEQSEVVDAQVQEQVELAESGAEDNGNFDTRQGRMMETLLTGRGNVDKIHALFRCFFALTNNKFSGPA